VADASPVTQPQGEVPLTPKMIGQLALEASSRNQRISELAKDLLLAVAEKGLIDEVLKE
jgi:hypothetical protein